MRTVILGILVKEALLLNAGGIRPVLLFLRNLVTSTTVTPCMLASGRLLLRPVTLALTAALRSSCS